MRVVLDLSAFRNHLVHRDIRPTAGTTTACRARIARRSTTGPSTPIAPARRRVGGLPRLRQRSRQPVNGVRYGDDATIAVISIAGEPMPPGSRSAARRRRPPADRLLPADPRLPGLDRREPPALDGWAHPPRLARALRRVVGHRRRRRSSPWPRTPCRRCTPTRRSTPGTGRPSTTRRRCTARSPTRSTSPGSPRSSAGRSRSATPRAGRYAWLYAEQDAYGSDGALFWNLGLEEAGGSHDVNPATPQTWAEVQAR